MQKNSLLNNQFIKKNFENYFFIIILIAPFLEFINQNIIEFENYITFQFFLLAILLCSLQYLLIFLFKSFFHNIDANDYKNCFCIIVYLQFKFQIIRIFLSNLGIQYDGELALILLILLTIIIIRLYKKSIFN